MLRIKLLRMSLGLSQWQLAQAAKLSQGRYSMIERGLIVPTDEERHGFSQILNVPASTLFRSAIRSQKKDRKPYGGID